jgi:hypothetical protein
MEILGKYEFVFHQFEGILYMQRKREHLFGKPEQ